MNIRTRERLNQFLSTKRIVLFSLAISVGIHLLFMFAFFFGESLFVGSEKLPAERSKVERQYGPSHENDTLRFKDASRLDPPHRQGRDGDNGMPGFPKRFRFDMMTVHIVFSFILVCIVFAFARKMMTIDFRKKGREAFFIIMGSMLITTVVSAVSSNIILVIDPFNHKGPFSFRVVIDCLVRDYALMSIAIMTCYLVRSLYYQKAIAVENEELRTENLRSHYEALKKQLDPHFLFNSLNTLQSLINFDPGKAGDYVQQLSSVLRYTLQNKEVVTLADEMACVRDYCAMMQIRYGDNLKVEIEVDPKYGKYKVLPFAIQGLVENAIKHNVVSSKQPLVIHIVTDDEARLKVSNLRQPKLDDRGNGIGLANLAERYRLQWDKEVLVCDDGTRFEVVLQLIEN